MTTTAELISSPVCAIRRRKVWVTVRDSARKLSEICCGAELAFDDLPETIWKEPAAVSGGYMYRDLWVDIAACEKFIFDAVYAGANWSCPTHGEDADEQGRCGCSCII